MHRTPSKASIRSTSKTPLLPYTVYPTYQEDVDAFFPDSPDLSRLLWKYVWSVVGTPVYKSLPLLKDPNSMKLTVRSHVVFRDRPFYVPYATGFSIFIVNKTMFITLTMYSSSSQVSGRIGPVTGTVTFSYDELPRPLKTEVRRAIHQRALSLSRISEEE